MYYTNNSTICMENEILFQNNEKQIEIWKVN